MTNDLLSDMYDCEYCDGEGKIDNKPCPHCRDGFKPIDICPRLIDDEYYELITAVKMLEHGIMPMAGGMSDQIAAFSQAIRHVAPKIQEWQKWQRKQERK